MKSFAPTNYQSVLDIWETEQAIKCVKDLFQTALSSQLKLRRITAPLAVTIGTGLNDNLNGVESPVSFPIPALGKKAEIVQSLAKWKRYALWKHQFQPGMGIYTDMNALRPSEEPDAIHSIYVDQWDWEKVILPYERNVETLYQAVKHIYSALLQTEFLLSERFPKLTPFLSDEIHFFTSEDLLKAYPDYTPHEREVAMAKIYGSIFVRGIGGALSDGSIHDNRSPDYDDWSTPTPDGTYGLNGDIIVWNPVLEDAFELSSMGIRVSMEALDKQLRIRHADDRRELMFHKLLLNGKLPQTMGGGIGQSRLCMLLLKKCHIGEVQAGIWSEDTMKACEEAGVFLR